MDQRQSFLIVAAALAIAASAVFCYATAWGIGLSPDSGFYLKSARHMLGREQVDPAQTREMSSHFPPAYPVVLAGVSAGGADPQAMARWVNLVLFAADAVLVAWMVFVVTGQSALAALLAGLFLIFSPDPLLIFSTALSEGLFICLVLVMFLMLGEFIVRGGNGWMIAAGLIAGAAVLTRYAGVALAPAGVIAILWLGKTPRRWREALLFLILCIGPVIVVAVINRILWGTSVNRTSVFHLVGWRHLRDGLLTAAQWVLPAQISKVKLLIGGASVAIACVAVWVLSVRRKSALAKVAAVFVACYVVTLGLSISFVDYHTPVDERLLLPVMIAMVIVAVDALWRLPRAAVLVAATLLLVVTIARGSFEARQMHREGIGYASPAWMKSELVQAVMRLPQEQAVYSNAADVVYLVAHRQALPVPAKVIATSTLANPDYEQQMTAMLQEIAAGKARLAFFRRFESKRPYYPAEADLRRHGLVEAERFNDGSIYATGGT